MDCDNKMEYEKYIFLMKLAKKHDGHSLMFSESSYWDDNGCGNAVFIMCKDCDVAIVGVDKYGVKWFEGR